MPKLSKDSIHGKVLAFDAAIRSLRLEIEYPLETDLREHVHEKQCLLNKLEMQRKKVLEKYSWAFHTEIDGRQ